ncbi:MAG: PD40 domain-containing protein [Anaerolineae bacterium]|nr:PD40 domain-containing protein [Anaerolineae bacterium]
MLSLSGHSAGVSSVDWSPDGSKIASGSDNGNVRVWNATSGGQLLSLSAHTGTVTSVAWNPDNRLLATTGVDGNLRIWDTTNGQLVSQISAVGFIYDAAWSPDGNKLAYGGASSTVNLIAPSNSGRGLRGAYYDNADFTALRYFRLNPTVNFIWRDFSPDPALIPVIGADTFSVRWTGKVEPLYSEAYTFYVTHDDGVRLWVNGQQIINNWTNQASSVTSSGTITLAAGVKYDIRLDYYENTFLAEVRLDWQSARQARQVIPASQLYPPEGQLAFNGITAAIGEIYVRNPDGTGEINLSNHAAADINPIWSPDGARVAWVSSRDGNQDIYLANVDGSGLRRLTNNTLIDAEPAWSPDGTKIIFRSTRSGGGDLYTMDVMGTGVPTPTRFTSSTLNDYDPMWSPNGKFVAYTVDTGGSTGPELYLLAVASNGLSPSGSPIRLTNRNGNDVTAFWSPDGSLIAFRAPYGSGGIGDQIWTVRTSSPYTLTRLTTQGNNNFQSWSPDSSKILFQSTRDGNQEIYTMNADGSGQTRLTNSSVAETYAVWSADARQIAYNRGNDIWLMNADGSNARNWTNTPARAEIEIVWWQVKQSR